MLKILVIFDNIGFLVQEDGTYIGYGHNEKHGKIKFEFKNHYLICTINNENKPSMLFSFIYGEIHVSVFITLLQDFNIIKYGIIEQQLNQIEKDFEKQFS